MSVITTSPSIIMRREQAARMPFWLQVTTLSARNIRVVLRTPAEIIPSLLISVFFVIVYQASLGSAPNFLPGLAGKNYLGFVLPISIVSAALSGAGIAGLAIVRDIQTGYFNKLLLTPISRSALLLAAMIASAVILLLQTSAVAVVGLIMGLEPATGFPGLLAMLGIALLLGVAFGGFTVGIALRSGSAGATQGATFLFFPLTFLTATFVPLQLLTGWIRTAATFNPVTYILEAMRGLLLNGWEPEILARGVITCVGLAVFTFIFALTGLRSRTRTR